MAVAEIERQDYKQLIPVAAIGAGLGSYTFTVAAASPAWSLDLSAFSEGRFVTLRLPWVAPTATQIELMGAAGWGSVAHVRFPQVGLDALPKLVIDTARDRSRAAQLKDLAHWSTTEMDLDVEHLEEIDRLGWGITD